MARDAAPSDWLAPYIAGVVDNHFNLVVTLSEDNNRTIGVRVQPTLRYNFEREATREVLEQYCHRLDITPRVTRKDTTYEQYEFVIGRRDDIQQFLEPLHPYLVVRADAITILTDDIIPALNEGAHSDKDSFLQLAQTIDTFRQKAGRANRAEYDYEYFKDKWET